MMVPPRRWIALAAALSVAAVLHAGAQAPLSRLSDQEFWNLVTDASEPGGAFHSDNFTSNEAGFAAVAGTLAAAGPHGGAYLGVGPEQNFHYIAAIRPAVAVLFDIRRQAVVQHLLYKALFELSRSREEFIARLFSVAVPDRVDPKAAPEALWRGFRIGPGDDRARLSANIAEVKTYLTRTRGFALSDEDLKSLEYVYEAFFRFGPEIDYAGDTRKLSTGNTNFFKLTSAVDGGGVPRSFLASDASFQFIRSMHSRNLIVPIQADFGGPKALRVVGEFLRGKGLSVSAFYISNVEQYLFNPRMPAAPNGFEINGGWRAFYDNLATLPADNSTILLRVPLGNTSTVVTRRMPDGTVRTEPRLAEFCPLLPFLAAVRDGKITTQSQANGCGR